MIAFFMKYIESFHNPFIRNILKLQDKSRERRKQGLFTVEGKREICLAIKGGYTIDTILAVSDSIDENISFYKNEFEVVRVSHQVYQKIAYRASTEGLMALVSSKKTALDQLVFQNKNPLILIAVGIEKPGNIGAMLRTADAANIDAVILADTKTDVFNPNVIRSSLGSVFTNQIAIGNSQEIIDFLEEKNISIFSATLQNSNTYTREDYTRGCALVVGSEATGLTEIWRSSAKQHIYIPMEGLVDSMNVSVAAAILIFEAKRQRQTKN